MSAGNDLSCIKHESCDKELPVNGDYSLEGTRALGARVTERLELMHQDLSTHEQALITAQQATYDHEKTVLLTGWVLVRLRQQLVDAEKEHGRKMQYQNELVAHACKASEDLQDAKLDFESKLAKVRDTSDMM